MSKYEITKEELEQYAKQAGVTTQAIRARINSGWKLEELGRKRVAISHAQSRSPWRKRFNYGAIEGIR